MDRMMAGGFLSRSLGGVVIVASLALIAFAAGLMNFAQRVSLAAPPADPPAADAVVALTGGGGARLKAAMGLMERGVAPQLMISGVNAQISDTAIASLTGGPADLYDCCVTLGRQATTTIGNAQEAAAWAQENAYGSLIIVTSDYHMPRALMELRRVLADTGQIIDITAYPVPRMDADQPWWRDAKARERLTVEYAKYLSVSAREAVRSGLASS